MLIKEELLASLPDDVLFKVSYTESYTILNYYDRDDVNAYDRDSKLGRILLHVNRCRAKRHISIKEMLKNK